MESRRYNLLGLFFLSLFLLLFFTACNQGTHSSKMQGSGGKTNELVLVIDDNMTINSPVVDTVRTFFAQNDLYLPQPEPLYSVSTVSRRDLNSQIAIQRHHNVVIVHISDTIKQSGVASKTDVWATPQLVIQFNATSDTAFYRIFDAYSSKVLEMLDHNEMLRARNLTDFGKNLGLSDEIYKQFDLIMSIPAGFYVAKKTDDFLWFYQSSNRKKEDMTASIMIWQRPYIAELQFSTDSMIADRNKVGQQFIEGPTAGSYMKTATNYIYPQTEIVSDYATKFAVEMRGLWDLQGDFMGGPFISYTFVHPTTQKLITIDAFLYHPNHDKRPLLRQLQAIITNVSFPTKE